MPVSSISPGGPKPTVPAPPRGAAGEPTLAPRNIIAGEVFATRAPVEIRTLLGSCVAACLYDPRAGVGGMNHFMLPQQSRDAAASARYGVHAMELLINQIMQLGGDRRLLQAKVFGGANVVAVRESGLHVGAQNAAFVTQFLAVERIPLLAHRLGGEHALRVHFFPQTGKALVKTVGRDRAQEVLRRQQELARQAAEAAARASEVTLF